MDLNFICTASISNEMFPSRHVIVQNVGPDSPVPEDVAWALRPLPPAVPVVDPFKIDARAQAVEARRLAQVMADATKPRHSYTTPELAARLALTPEQLTECIDSLGCPKPRMAYETRGVLMNGPVRGFHLFDGPDTDRWVEIVERLFGKRRHDSKRNR
jgi:hypothetical protein